MLEVARNNLLEDLFAKFHIMEPERRTVEKMDEPKPLLREATERISHGQRR
jgi:hypothetical protein